MAEEFLALASEENITNLLNNKDSSNTIKATKIAVALFQKL